jgi:hypothetical protein
MINIESLKDYIGIISNNEFMELATKIYMITDFICEDYPKYYEWYFTKQLPSIISNNRNILFARDPNHPDEIIAMSCLKKDKEENKICTLYVSNKYRGLGIGTSIIEKSMNWLETTKPLITFADYKLDMFRPIINKYNWELTEIVSNLYNDKSQELCFNGTLTKNSDCTLEPQLHKRLVKVLNNRIKNINK